MKQSYLHAMPVPRAVEDVLQPATALSMAGNNNCPDFYALLLSPPMQATSSCSALAGACCFSPAHADPLMITLRI